MLAEDLVRATHVETTDPTHTASPPTVATESNASTLSAVSHIPIGSERHSQQEQNCAMKFL